MEPYKIRLFTDAQSHGVALWKADITAPNLENAILQAKERSAIPAFEKGARFVVLSDKRDQTVWSSDMDAPL